MAASFLLPCLPFAFGTWTAHRNINVLADERLVRSLDIEQEEATKTFELIEPTMSDAIGLIADMSTTDVRDNEERLHLQFKRYFDSVAVPLSRPRGRQMLSWR
jgi:hypothetical protein